MWDSTNTMGHEVLAIDSCETMDEGHPVEQLTQSDPDIDQSEIFLAGFRDCTAEAIKYLLEVEQLSEDDPIIIGLRHHLATRQHYLDNLHPDTESHHSNLSPRTAELSPHPCDDADISYGDQISDTEADNSHIQDSSGIESDMDSSINILATTPHPDLVLSSESEKTTQNLPSDSDTMEEIHESNSDGLSLSYLAQNNPDIANITKELIELLEEEAAACFENEHEELNLE